mgnify:CR=1 FL=1
MKIEFKMSYKLGLLEFKVGDQLEISKEHYIWKYKW